MVVNQSNRGVVMSILLSHRHILTSENTEVKRYPIHPTTKAVGFLGWVL